MTKKVEENTKVTAEDAKKNGKGKENITITDAELMAYNVLNNTVANAQAELQKTLQARTAYINLLESRYMAKLNPKTGELEPLKNQPKEK